MRFWDSSALVPLVVEEERSRWCRALRRENPTLVVWALTRTEMVSAAQRLRREGLLDSSGLASAMRRLDLLAKHWTEVEAFASVRERAERLLGAHPLAAADALQLGAALVMVEERPRKKGFVTADERLAEAARAEGFSVYSPGA